MNFETFKSAIALAIGGTASYILGRLIYSWLIDLGALFKRAVHLTHRRYAYESYLPMYFNIKSVSLAVNIIILLLLISILLLFASIEYRPLDQIIAE